ncbi:MAG: hypothetical protein MUC83_10345, partial [Pirellula sp.]|nr:hypothetical protein [Pirellula sp.]
MPKVTIRNLGLYALLVNALGAIFSSSHAKAIDVVVERNRDSDYFQFPTIPLPVINDDGVNATWAIARGMIDGNSAGLSVLYDGKMPSTNDSPEANFFFAGSMSARSVALDLGKT